MLPALVQMSLLEAPVRLERNFRYGVNRGKNACGVITPA